MTVRHSSRLLEEKRAFDTDSVNKCPSSPDLCDCRSSPPNSTHTLSLSSSAGSWCKVWYDSGGSPAETSCMPIERVPKLASIRIIATCGDPAVPGDATPTETTECPSHRMPREPYMGNMVAVLTGWIRLHGLSLTIPRSNIHTSDSTDSPSIPTPPCTSMRVPPTLMATCECRGSGRCPAPMPSSTSLQTPAASCCCARCISMLHGIVDSTNEGLATRVPAPSLAVRPLPDMSIRCPSMLVRANCHQPSKPVVAGSRPHMPFWICC
mmetsp:Transcript_25337/g.51587  ORF Transcript_25337/g.51587 Transcript_25337/m.51587 type:complete len:266 (-) Transcript_25337:209-1006(-)